MTIGGANERYGGKSGFLIKLKAKEGKTRREAEDSVDGVQIKKEDPDVRTPESCYNMGDHNDTPGGVLFDNASSAAQYYLDYDDDGQYEQCLTTADHVVIDGVSHCDTDTQTGEVEQNGDTWGEIVKRDKGIDVAVCSPYTSDGMGVEGYIQDGLANNNPTVMGFVTKNGLADLKAADAEISQMGIKTGYSTGQIEELEYGDYGCRGYNSEGVRTSLDTAAGDSGSPVYHMDGGDAYMVNVHSVGVGSSSREACDGTEITPSAAGGSAYNINDDLGGQWVAPI